MKIIKAFVAGMVTTIVIQGVILVYGMTRNESEVKTDENN